MDESKKAAKAFVDRYFPVRDPNPKPSNVWGDLFQQPNSKTKKSCFIKFDVESHRRHGYGSQSLNSQNGTADGKLKGSSNKSQSMLQKGSSAVEHCEISEPCLMSSSVDYGCRDNYPYNPENRDNYRYNPDSRYPGPSSYVEKKDRKDSSEYPNSEISGGAEWWQGSFYY